MKVRITQSKIHGVASFLIKTDNVAHYSWELISCTGGLTEADHPSEQGNSATAQRELAHLCFLTR